MTEQLQARASGEPVRRGGAPQPRIVEAPAIWRAATVPRLSFLIDGLSYFAKLAEAIRRAQRSIYIVGWDIDSRTHLGSPDDPEIPSLRELLEGVVEREPQLEVRILSWDFAPIYSFEREMFPRLKLGWTTDPRIAFRLDGNHPLGASHHQKIVVIDDRLAFVGGLDITERRWDTPEHLSEDSRRVTTRGERYGPFHDVQVAVDGGVAKSLGELVRERWLRASGQQLAEPDGVTGDPWPPSLAPDLTDALAGIARTEPAWDGAVGVREVERLHVDAIRSARRLIYVENQYLTSSVIADALAATLRRPHGPQLIIIAPERCSGWLEQVTMGVLRARLLDRLRRADRFGRFAIFCPKASPTRWINVHSKVMIVDDDFVRVGSANLSNRSMGFDSECDIAVEAASSEHRATIARLRDRLLAHHLRIAPDELQRALERSDGDIGSAVAALQRDRTEGLFELSAQIPRWLDETVPAAGVLDPERPLHYADLVADVLPPPLYPDRGRPLLRRLLSWTAVAVALLVWRVTPLATIVDPRDLAGPAASLPGWAAPLLIALTFVVAAPLSPSALIIATVLWLGPMLGTGYALLGLVTSALVSYGVGRALGPARLRTLTESPLDAAGQRLVRASIVGVAKARWLPLASFSLLNVVSGAWRVRLPAFVAGAVLGMLPGAACAAIFAAQLRRATLDPSMLDLCVLFSLLGAMYAGAWWLHVRFGRPRSVAGD